MKNIGLIGVLVLALVTSCMAATLRIADGVYREPAKVETVTTNGELIEFQVRVVAGDQDRIVNRRYNYSLQADGKIRVIASSNDSVFVFGIMKYDWSWDGKSITRKDPKTGEVVTFTSGPKK
jgi:hypothetical protein